LSDNPFNPFLDNAFVSDEGFTQALEVRDMLKDQSFQEQVDNHDRTIQAFQAIRPDLSTSRSRGRNTWMGSIPLNGLRTRR